MSLHSLHPGHLAFVGDFGAAGTPTVRGVPTLSTAVIPRVIKASTCLQQQHQQLQQQDASSQDVVACRLSHVLFSSATFSSSPPSGCKYWTTPTTALEQQPRTEIHRKPKWCSYFKMLHFWSDATVSFIAQDEGNLNCLPEKG